MSAFLRHCPACRKFAKVELTQKVLSEGRIICPNCGEAWGEIKNPDDIFDYCPFCPGRQFYTTKDFSQILGCGILLVGIILVPFTYGLSLAFLALIDWFLHKKAPTIVVCYRCGSEFHGFEAAAFKPFLHHIGLKYDKYR